MGSSALGASIAIGAVAQMCGNAPTTTEIIANAEARIVGVFEELFIFNITSGLIIDNLTSDVLNTIESNVIAELNPINPGLETLSFSSFSFSNTISRSEIEYTSALRSFEIKILNTNITWTSDANPSETGLISGNLIFTFTFNDANELTTTGENAIQGMELTNTAAQIDIAAGVNGMLRSNGITDSNPLGASIYSSLLQNANRTVPIVIVPDSTTIDSAATEILNLSFRPIEPSRVIIQDPAAAGGAIYRVDIGNVDNPDDDNSFFILTSTNFANSGTLLSFILSPTSIFIQDVGDGNYNLVNEDVLTPSGLDRPINSSLITVPQEVSGIINSDVINLFTRFISGDASSAITGLNELYQYSFSGLEPPILSGAGITLSLLEVAIRDLLNAALPPGTTPIEFVFVTSITSLNPVALNSIDSIIGTDGIFDINDQSLSFDLSGLEGSFAMTNEDGVIDLSVQRTFSIPENADSNIAFGIPIDNISFSSIVARIEGTENIVISPQT